MSHVFVRLSGHRLVLLPFWPYRFARTGADPASVRVTHWRDGGAHETVIDAAQRSSVAGIVEVGDGGHEGDWLIETRLFHCQWPQGFTVESASDPGDHVKFYLYGSTDHVMVFPQGPTAHDKLPDSWATEGQTVIDTYRIEPGIDVIELAYDHDGTPWWQGQWLTPYGPGHTLVVTAQAPATHADEARAAACFVATTSQPTVGD